MRHRPPSLFIRVLYFALLAPRADALTLSYDIRICDDPYAVACATPLPASTAGAVIFDADSTVVPAGSGATVSNLLQGTGFDLVSASVSNAPGLPPQVRVHAAGDGIGSAIAAGSWSDNISITVLALPTTAVLTVNPVISVNGQMNAAGNEFGLTGAGVNVFHQAFVVQAGGVFPMQFVPISRSNTCSLGSTSTTGNAPMATCNGGGVPVGMITGTGVTVPNDGRANQWRFDIFAFGSNATFANNSFNSDFSATVDWLGFEVRDSEGHLLDFTATSAAGVDWSQSSVPEPSTGAFVALGVAALAGYRRRAR